MSLAEHLLELRKRLTYAALGLAVGAIAGWFLTPYVWDALRAPVLMIAEEQGRQAQINYGDVTSAFNVRMQIAMFLSALITAPVWLYQIWAFLMPGLTRKEKLWGVSFIGAAIPLFLGGCFTGWLVFPNFVRLMSSFAPAEDSQIMDASVYLVFVLRLMLTMGAAFVLPLLLVLLNFLGVISGIAIVKGWRWAVLASVVFCALATPAADLFSMFVLAAPLIGLYLIAALISVLHDRRANKRHAAEMASLGVE